MLACYSLQSLHYEMVVIQCYMLPLHRLEPVHAVPVQPHCAVSLRNTNFPQFFVDIFHECCNSLTDGSEVMIIHFLSFWRHCSEQCTSCVDQVFSLQIFLHLPGNIPALVQQMELLFLDVVFPNTVLTDSVTVH